MKNKSNDSTSIILRPITEDDTEFLYLVYASTREDEMAITGWNKEQIEDFLRMQFQLQHKQYLTNYENPSFDIILINDVPAGRLYVERKKDEMRIIDIALLPEFRRQSIGTKIMEDLTGEAERKRLPLSLHVEYNNPILGFYERLGFRKKGVNGIYCFMRREPGSKKPVTIKKRRENDRETE